MKTVELEQQEYTSEESFRLLCRTAIEGGNNLHYILNNYGSYIEDIGKETFFTIFKEEEYNYVERVYSEFYGEYNVTDSSEL